MYFASPITFIPENLEGGVATTIANLIEQVSGEINFKIFTRDRDKFLNKSYKGIKVNQWNETPQGEVYYASPHQFGIRGLLHVLRSSNIDIIYLNSFFSFKASIIPLIYIRFNLRKYCLILAPRGELYPGALSCGKYKKKLFIYFAKLLSIHKNICWQASTPKEALAIQHIIPAAANNTLIAIDPIKKSFEKGSHIHPTKKPGKLAMIYLSTITPKKNLDGLLRTLMNVRSEITLDIYGPTHNKKYWIDCAKLINKLPSNVSVIKHKPVSSVEVIGLFSKYDLFAFPTLGENFGHVIYESLSAGTPVLVSEFTPWQTILMNL